MLYAALLDDAALFPPGDAPMAEAVAAHRRYRLGAQAPLTGPFVVPADRLAELAELAEEAGADAAAPLRVCVTVPEGPGGVGRALQQAASMPALEPVAAEVAAGAPDDDRQAAADTARAAAALDAHLPAGAAGCVELPRGADPRRVLDALAGSGHRAKLRTGGVRAPDFPGESELADALCAAVERGRALKCTAGLHNAVRHTAAGTGFEHHGFVNVLLAVHAAVQGAGAAEVAGVLALRDGARAAAHAAALGAADARAVRALFTSIGTCSVLEPLGDLVGLGLLSPAVLE
ncbi:hypothetical protein [Streptomonospora litoralis]|uniref:hypothetical protein n=1 Tax=Streptomonospora litoralis TaxID=2498135 RepID=UPI001036D9DF|nr:hypothetical protein [Streptomonospora litoralis]